MGYIMIKYCRGYIIQGPATGVEVLYNRRDNSTVVLGVALSVNVAPQVVSGGTDVAEI